MKLQTAPGTNELVIGESSYVPDADGCIDVHDAHIRSAKALGCTVPDDDAPQSTVIVDDAHGNADLKRANAALTHQIAALKDQLDAVNNEISSANARIIVLRGRIGLGDDDADDAPVSPAPATETATEDADEVDDDHKTPAVEEKAEDADDGRVVPDFDTMEYNGLKAWLKDNGVAVNAHIRKPDAVEAAKARYAELFGSKE